MKTRSCVSPAREDKITKRKLTNAASAKRSRERKQAEVKRLQHLAESLTIENSQLKDRLASKQKEVEDAKSMCRKAMEDLSYQQQRQTAILNSRAHMTPMISVVGSVHIHNHSPVKTPQSLASPLSEKVLPSATLSSPGCLIQVPLPTTFILEDALNFNN